MPRRARETVITNAHGSFCRVCGASLVKLTAAQLRILAAIMVVQEEYEASPQRPDFLPRHVVKRAEIEDRTGLNGTTIDLALPRLRALGYVIARKGYGRAHLAYRLSDDTRADLELMSEIAARVTFLRPASRRLGAANLEGVRKS